eukprot:COSAG01_NODE_4402_length_5061_cov_2.146917_2_plen_84_part_00
MFTHCLALVQCAVGGTARGLDTRHYSVRFPVRSNGVHSNSAAAASRPDEDQLPDVRMWCYNPLADSLCWRVLALTSATCLFDA